MALLILLLSAQSSKWIFLYTSTILLSSLYFSIQISAAGNDIPAVIVFGDSSVDSGNNNQYKTLLRSNFKPYGRDFAGGQPTGRFCNGRIPPDFISEGFGLRPSVPAYLDPAYGISDFALGVCFASAGTGYDNATSDVLNVIPLWKEVEYYKEYQAKLRAYLGPKKANRIFRRSAYLVSLGTNDFLENYFIFPKRRFQFTVQEYQDFLISIATDFFRQIHSLGARRISLTGLPPMGCLPLERTVNILGHNECNEKLNGVAMEFNKKLGVMADKLNRELSGFRLVFTESLFDFVYNIIKKPGSFGFEESGVACCSTGTIEMSYLCSELSPWTCNDANKFVFWDAFHLTERTNHIISAKIIPLLKDKFLS